MSYKEVEGDLIKLAQEGEFDVIVHGCNCFCTMGAGIAPQMAKAFGADIFDLEHPKYKGDVNKLGIIDYKEVVLSARNSPHKSFLTVVNAYTQYSYGRNHADGVKKPLDYEALTLCLRKINIIFAGKKIGFPQIGAGLASGNWNLIQARIEAELRDCDVTVVIYKP